MFICLFNVNAANISESQLTAQFEFSFQCTDIPRHVYPPPKQIDSTRLTGAVGFTLHLKNW